MENLENPTPDGVHYFVDFFGCETSQIDTVGFWEKVLPESVEKSKMTVLKSFFYEFEPHGVTGFLLLSSSHLSIHTWPEHQYVACDVFSCSTDGETKKIIKYLEKNIKHERIQINKQKRGFKVC